MIEIINQIYAIETKANKVDNTLFDRNIERIYHEFETQGFQIINPLGKVYRNEMTDVEANIIGHIDKKLKIVKVLKPIVYKNDDQGEMQLIQKGIVIVE